MNGCEAYGCGAGKESVGYYMDYLIVPICVEINYALFCVT